jgi:aryl-alcohol dehydrogenase-like predicted oxidoreductase
LFLNSYCTGARVETRRIATLEVSVIGLGCNNFGWRIDEPGSHAVVNAALDAGINFFDTSDTYGKTKSEEFLGRALGARRASVIIATKFGSEIDAAHKGARPEYVRQACEDSLRRLGTDYIDLYQLHRPDPTTPIADTIGAMNELVGAGKVLQIGCSNFSATQIAEAERESERLGATKFSSVQNNYNMLEREDETNAIPECERLGIAYLPYFPLASGMLTGKIRKGKPILAGTRIADIAWMKEKLTERNVDVIERLITFASVHKHTILELAMSWLLRLPVVASVIAGATSPDQVRANAAAANWRLSASDLASVEGILSGS